MLKKVAYFLLTIAILLAVVAFIFVQNNKPVYNGSKTIEGLQEEVSVYFDTYGVPHIFANSEADAYQALGYVHAQDRLWQMELIRRIAAGRLAEIFGEQLVKTDKLFRGMGVEYAAKNFIEQIDSSSQSFLLSQAYLDGINNFIDEGKTPIEYQLIGVEK